MNLAKTTQQKIIIIKGRERDTKSEKLRKNIIRIGQKKS